jgi:hypothetical protein
MVVLPSDEKKGGFTPKAAKWEKVGVKKRGRGLKNE